MGKSYLDRSKYSWRVQMQQALQTMLESDEILASIPYRHIRDTPERYVKALDEYVSGCFVDPKVLLSKALFSLEDETPQMIHVGGQQFYSKCAHHMEPFFGRMHFAYIPSTQLIGLSKIPRLIEVYARRLQVQEHLTNNIVDAFQEVVQPQGCALLVRATHFCMEARGVRAHGAETTTTALRGIFTDQKVKEEFLMAANRLEWRV